MKHSMSHLVLLLALVGCVRPGGTAESAGAGAATIVRGSEMNGMLLSGLQARVPAMSVQTTSSACPRIVFRGQRSALQQGDPTVYVDGTRMQDTCILLQIPVLEVDYVEIYMGSAGRPAGLPPNPFGTILVHRHRR
jgi:hypothetical protein